MIEADEETVNKLIQIRATLKDIREQNSSTLPVLSRSALKPSFDEKQPGHLAHRPKRKQLTNWYELARPVLRDTREVVNAQQKLDRHVLFSIPRHISNKTSSTICLAPRKLISSYEASRIPIAPRPSIFVGKFATFVSERESWRYKRAACLFVMYQNENNVVYQKKLFILFCSVFIYFRYLENIKYWS